MSDAFVFHTYIYIIIKAITKREPAKKEFDRAIKAILEYNPKTFSIFEEVLFNIAKEEEEKILKEKLKKETKGEVIL